MSTHSGNMLATAPSTLDQRPTDPWFRRRPGLALLLAGAMYAAVLIVRLAQGTPSDASSLLYVFPVALVAMTFGVRAGTAAGALAVALTVVWAVAQDVEISPLGWASRALPLLLLGALVGHATERIRRAEQERRDLHTAALLHRDAIEVNDTLVQGMAAAKWALESGRTDQGLRTLDETLVQAQEMVSSLIREARLGHRTESPRVVEPPPV